MAVSMQKLFKQGNVGSGHHGHKGRVGLVGGSLPRGAMSSPVAKKYHNKVNDEGLWGYSHSQSSHISGEAAAIMGIEEYEVDDQFPNNRRIYRTAANKFLTAISEDEIGAEETLYHGFQNVRGTVFKPGDTFKIPLTATSGGGIDDVAGYGLRLDRIDQKGQCTIFVFPEGTPMAAYQKWNNEDAKEFGYKYTEAIVAGEFRVVSSVIQEIDSPQHDSRPGETWHPTSTANIVTLEPISIFDMETRTWRK